jgi:hypothetical protein
MAATIQLKRGKAEAIARHNPILKAGEPCFVTDENRLKIGDGVTAWKDLPYVGESSVINAKTHYDFPSIGRDNVIYKAESESLLYQWDSETLTYEVVGAAEITGDLADIKIIHGGSATENIN